MIAYSKNSVLFGPKSLIFNLSIFHKYGIFSNYKFICRMSESGFWNKSDYDLKIASLGPLLVWFLVEVWSDKCLIWRFLGLIFCLAALIKVCLSALTIFMVTFWNLGRGQIRPAILPNPGIDTSCSTEPLSPTGWLFYLAPPPLIWLSPRPPPKFPKSKSL